MNKTLILVESPTKARTLFRFLKGDYQIEASMGHVRDLPKGDLGIDVDDNFSPQYVIPRDKRKVVEKLKDEVKQFKQVILATDPDREGEAIAHHLYELLKKETVDNTTFSRIVFHEITSSAIHEAIEHPRHIDEHLVAAQTARRVLDRIVGYKLSPLLWHKIKPNLSGGRVQSVALRLIVEREREIEKFASEAYFRVAVMLSRKGSNNAIEFGLIQVNGQGVEQTIKVDLYDGEYKYTKTNLSQEVANRIKEDLRGLVYTVSDVAKKETRRSPYPPFITSTLTQDASRHFGFPSKKTMTIAQRLYEEGFITYHRTDSFNLSRQFIVSARSFIEKDFGQKYLSPSPRVFKTRSKVAQEAHEAIRPTSVGESQSASGRIKSQIGRDAERLYSLIYKRAIATQMADALFESTKILVEAKDPSTLRQAQGSRPTYLFEKNGSVLKFDGFLKLVGVSEVEDIVPDVVLNEKLEYQDASVSQHSTNPPPRYSEAGLIGALEKHGIGRPSTYAPIISTIQGRYYVERKEGRFFPTEIGMAVNDFLVKKFPDVDDIPFTATMEDGLDEIADGKRDWVPMIREFYGPFEKKVDEAEKSGKVEVPLEKTGKTCPTCRQGELVIRYGKFGKFFACSRFPDCKYTAPLLQETNAICPQDGGKIVVRKTRKGRTFYGCANYPKCKFAVWNLKDLEKNSK